jgi:hypothetical protein
MFITVTCQADEASAYIEHYESSGFQLVSKTYEEGIATIVLRGYSSSQVAMESYYNPNTQAHLEFSDGTTSKLHVRRSCWMDD